MSLRATVRSFVSSGRATHRPRIKARRGDFYSRPLRLEQLEDRRLLSWQTILSDGFEGTFPGAWSRSGYPTWGKTAYMASTGTWSAYCVEYGEPAPGPYPSDVEAWMTYGPFDLSNATDAKMDFWYWNQSEPDCDYFCWMASSDGEYFDGFSTSGYQADWQSETLDLSGYVGQSNVWVAFIFTSDESYGDYGAFVDDVVISKYVEAPVNQPPTISGLPDRTLNEDTTLNNTIDLWAYASDVETPDSGLIFSITGNTSPQVGVSIDSNRYIDINPTANWFGFSDVTIQVSDGLLTDDDTFRITVNSVNDAPTISGLPDRTLNEDTTLNNTIDLWAYASDVETADSSLIFTITGNSSPQVGVSIDSNRYIDINPTANWSGFSDVTIQVSDGALTATDVFRITVNPTNDPPTIDAFEDAPDPVTQPSLLTLTATVSDVDGQVVRVEFYRDDNDTGTLEPELDEYLGTGTDNSGVWSWSGSSGAFALGTNLFFARAQDDASQWSDLAATQTTVVAALVTGDYDGNQAVEEADYDFWKANFGATSGPGLAADGSDNGVVDAADYTVWRDNYHPGPGIPGDYDGNQSVEQADFDFWKANFGATSGPGLTADGNSNGVVDAADYTVWRDNLATGAGTGATVREAASPLADGNTVASLPLMTESGETAQDAVVVVHAVAASKPKGGAAAVLAARLPVNETARSALVPRAAMHVGTRAGDSVIQARHREMALLRLTRVYGGREYNDAASLAWRDQHERKPGDETEIVDAALAEMGRAGTLCTDILNHHVA